jgi:membrane protease YdiL (CAAX protease family)
MESPLERAPIAHPLHTIVVIAAFLAWAFLGTITADRMRSSESPHRIRLYISSILFEWAVLGVIAWGVRRHGGSLSAVLGPRWTSPRRFLRDIGVAAAFWFVSGLFLILFSRLLRADTGPQVQFLLPRARAEQVLWVLVALTAGICEEALFRGYLQHQLIAFTRSVSAGVILSAVVFGAGHAYQGLRSASLIAIYGLMFGLLAEWRKTVRPGMIAHAWQDTLSGLVLSLRK